MDTTYARIPLDSIDVEGNYRRIFPAKELAELATSIRKVGVQAPIRVRPRGEGRYGLVAGERRVRASALDSDALDEIGPAPTDIPDLIEELTDAEVRERQLVENHGRADVHPLDEAARFAEMRDKDSHTADTISALVGKSPAWVRERLRLCELAPGPRQLFVDDKLSASVALLVARIPVAKLQEEYSRAVASGRQVQDLDGRMVIEPMSFREAKALAGKYMLRLDAAPFDITDEALVVEAGACRQCPHRTGNQRELFPEVKSADICTNPPCFDGKRKASWDRKAADATRQGLRVLTDKEQRRVFAAGATVPSVDSPFVDLASPLPMDLADATGKATWMQLAGKNPPDPVVAQDGTGAPRDLVDRAAVLERAKAAGLLKDGPVPVRQTKQSALSSAEMKAQRERDAQKSEVRRRVIRAQLGALTTAAIPDPKTNAAERDLWWCIATAVIDEIDPSALEHVVVRRELKLGKAANAEAVALHQLKDSCKTVGALRALVVEVLAATAAPTPYAGANARYKELAEVLGVDLKAVEAETVAAAKAESKDKAPAASASAKKKPGSPEKLFDGHGIELDWDTGKPIGATSTPAKGKKDKGLVKAQAAADKLQAAELAAARSWPNPKGKKGGGK